MPELYISARVNMEPRYPETVPFMPVGLEPSFKALPFILTSGWFDGEPCTALMRGDTAQGLEAWKF